jgi:hypothetical protein
MVALKARGTLLLAIVAELHISLLAEEDVK